tara:strand:+ start:346 stop:483 length:138 start_codon:yes stop_codon:yes gene_type:complete
MTAEDMEETLMWWSLNALSPHYSKEYKKHYQDKLDKVKKLVEELK